VLPALHTYCELGFEQACLSFYASAIAQLINKTNQVTAPRPAKVYLWVFINTSSRQASYCG
jgi:hypothetical protein